jgi:hypothetical protein
METLASLFDWINEFLGVSSAGQLVVHPVFIGLCVIFLLYAFLTGQKFVGLAMVGLLGGGVITHYLYPPGHHPPLTDLLTFIAAMGGLLLILIYIGFIRD